jgi:hypothetical protein
MALGNGIDPSAGRAVEEDDGAGDWQVPDKIGETIDETLDEQRALLALIASSGC